MNTERDRKKSFGNLIALVLILVLCLTVSVSLLFGRFIPYISEEFKNVHSLTDETQGGSGSDSNSSADGENSQASSDGTSSENGSDGSETSENNGASGNGSSANNDASGGENGQTTSTGQSTEKHHPEFHMEAEEEIFKFSYDETGKITVIGPEGNTDKLIAPGTSNIYQFTLANTGDVALDYTMTMEAYYTGTDLWIPVDARVWDHTNRYIVGSPDNKVDVLELNTVEESAELGAGRYAVYNLEWEWPFERGDDAYDTMLGNLAVDNDLVLHIVIRTVAEYDEDPDDPNAGLIAPPYTGDDSQLLLLCLLSAGSFAGLCIIFFAIIKSGRKEKKLKEKAE